MKKRCLFGIDDDLQRYAERITMMLLGNPLAPTMLDYGPVKVGVLHRDGRFQTELVVVGPGVQLPVHRHPGVDTIECPVAGLMRFTVHGVDPYEKIPDSRLERFQHGKLLRIDAGTWHAGRAGPKGASFLSMQRWDADASGMLGERWEGAPMSATHAAAYQNHKRPTQFETVAATEEHARYVGARLRAAEIAELWALSKVTPVYAAVESVRVSERAWCWMVDGAPAAIFGVASPNLLGDTGMPWLLTTDVVDQHPIKFLRSCARGMREMRAIYPKLVAFVDARHTVCVKWLEWLGATIHPAQPLGELGLPFHRFELNAGGKNA